VRPRPSPSPPPPLLPCVVVPARATPPAHPYEPGPATHTRAGPAASDRAQPQRCFPRPLRAPPRLASTLSDIPGASSSVPLLEKLSPISVSHFWGALQRLVRFGDTAVQHDDIHGTIDPERSAVFCAIRARGHRGAHSRQDRRLETER